MKRLALSALLLLLLGLPARADIVRPPPPPPPPPGETTSTVVAGVATATALSLAGVWLALSRRRTQLRG